MYYFIDPGYQTTIFIVDEAIAAANRYDPAVAAADAFDYFILGGESTDRHLIGRGSINLSITHDQSEVYGQAILYGDVAWYGGDVEGPAYTVWEASFTGSLEVI